MTQNGHERAELAHPAALRRETPLQPGDAIRLGAEPARIVRTVFFCREVVRDQVTDWRWVFLDDGSLLELAPKGPAWYRRHVVLAEGAALYDTLVGADGALARFERRVRDGTWASRPVEVAIDGRGYRLRFTGTLSARRLGAEPELSPWRLLRADSDENVYFGLSALAPDGDELVLGLWTTGVCLSFGRSLGSVEPRIER
jgi:hypothetical protein